MTARSTADEEGTRSVTSPEAIAVIGMAGRFPGACNIDEFWQNLVNGEESLSQLPDEQIFAFGESAERLAHPDYVRLRPMMPDGEKFDARFFGMTPRDAELREPQHRAFLETAHTVLEHGGYVPEAYPGTIGVYAGMSFDGYLTYNINPNRALIATVGKLAVETGTAADYLPTFVSYKLGLTGPSVNVQTACSTSLVAIHIACQALRDGECGMAIAGGVQIEYPYGSGYVRMQDGIYARDGSCRAFDADATGTNFGNGVGAVLLKRLSDAIADGDTIYATVLGSAINNDGSTKVGFTAPSVPGQSACVAAALANAGVDPRTVDYVEAHGTGTKIGDPIEIAALAEAFRAVAGEDLPPGSCGVGSVKSNVGHLGSAAGVTGFLKTVLSLWHGVRPRTINFDKPNPELALDTTPFYIQVDPTPWPSTEGTPRRAAVSSFGMGGTNASVLLEEAPVRTRPEASPSPSEVLVWSAKVPDALTELRGALAGHFRIADGDAFHDSAHTLRVGRASHRLRGALVATSAADAAVEMADPTSRRVLTADGTRRDVAFCFPGQGSQQPQMARGLYEREPVFRAGCDRAFEVLADVVGQDVRLLWLTAGEREPLAETLVAQPLLHVVEYTLAHTLMHWGVRPDVLLGHSVGELVAGAVAGVFGFEDGLLAVAERARLMQSMVRGRMLAVSLPPHELADLLADIGDGVVLAAVNSPGQCVLAGPADALDEVVRRVAARGATTRFLTTSHAFHSPSMNDAADGLRSFLEGMRLNAPSIPIVSCATGEIMTDEEAVSPEFWSGQLVRPVRFDRAVATAIAVGPRTLVEVGPGTALTSALRSTEVVRASDSLVVSTLPRWSGTEDRDGDLRAVDSALARLWVEGAPVRWERRSTGGYRRAAAPGYPYQRKLCWVGLDEHGRELPEPEQEPSEQPTATAIEPAPSADRPRWTVSAVEWSLGGESRAAVPEAGAAGRTAVVVLPGDPKQALLVRAAFQRAGYRVSWASEAGDALADAVERVLAAGAVPDVIGFAPLANLPATTSSSTVDDQLALGFYPLMHAVKQVARWQRAWDRPVHLVVLTRHGVDVSGAELLNPVGSMVQGLCRTVELEHPGVACVVIDIAAASEQALAEELGSLADPLVAVRGASRWLPVRRRIERTARSGVPRLRRGGVYVITGGLGGLGLTIAAALGETGLRPKIALLGRTAVPDSRGRAVIEELTANGAEVVVLSCDVGDLASATNAAEEIGRRFGQVHGVVHAAGVAGGGLVERRDFEDVAEVLHAKVHGVLALDEVFAGDRLDFFVAFSSAAGVNGLFGSADYAAANVFLDAHARGRSDSGCFHQSIGWPGWSEFGMAADAAVPLELLMGADAPTGTVGHLRTIAPGQDWELDEHVVDGKRVFPGSASLELVVQAAHESGVVPVDAPVGLEDVVFVAPLVADQPHEVRVRLTPDGSLIRFDVESRPVDGPPSWYGHLTGALGPSRAERTPVRIEELFEDADEVPWKASRGLVAVGPRWSTHSAAHLRGAEAAVARLSLTQSHRDEDGGRVLHPALLDVATGLLVNRGGANGLLPFLYRELHWFAPLTLDVVAHVRHVSSPAGLQVVDVDLYSPEGDHLVAVRGCAFRAIDDLVAEPASSPVAAGPAMMSPREGAELFMELLGGGYPASVLVSSSAEPGEVSPVPWAEDAPAPRLLSVEPAFVPTPARVEVRPALRPAPLGSELENALLRMWCEALGFDDVSLDDDFFDLGGNSLSAVQLVTRVRDRFDVRLGVGTLFEAGTARAFAARIAELRTS